MDQRVKPCDDFYRFTCGGWQANHIIPEDSSHISNFAILRDEVTVEMKHLLEKPVSANDLSTTRLCKRLYSSCMSRGILEKEGIRTLRTVANALRGLPIITNNYSAKESSFEELYSYSVVYGIVSNPFAFTITVDAKNSSIYRLKVRTMCHSYILHKYIAVWLAVRSADDFVPAVDSLLQKSYLLPQAN